MTLGTLLAGAGFAAGTRIGPDASYLTDVLPSVLLLGLGLSCAVSPLTAAVLGAAPESMVGAASGVNNAVARSAGLLAIAVIPGLVGLASLEGLEPAVVQSGFVEALWIGAGLMAAAALVSVLGVPKRRVTPLPREIAVHKDTCCPVGAPSLAPPADHATG
jgi:hypothetical protein